MNQNYEFKSDMSNAVTPPLKISTAFSSEIIGGLFCQQKMDVNALAPTRARRQQVNLTSKATWTKKEDELLTKIASQATSIQWSAVAKFFPNKTAPQLAGRWEKVLNPNLVKGSWTREEDEIILNFVMVNGDKDWANLALLLKGRTGKQCRERFKNHLDPNLAHTEWTYEDDNKLIELHEQLGNAWTKIATHFTGRTDNYIKNRWNSTLKKRIERIKSGQPLYMKRGRKPKTYAQLQANKEITLPKPEMSQENSGNQSACSSPVRPDKLGRNGPEIVSIIDSLPLIAARKTEPKKCLSLEENRQGLMKLINNFMA